MCTCFVAVGLLVYGVLRIINLAHGAFLALGAYAAVVTAWWGWTPWAAPPLAFAVGAGLAALVEWRVLRELYSRPLDTILATWGLNIIVVQGITVYFGREIQFAASPIERAVTSAERPIPSIGWCSCCSPRCSASLVWLVVQRTSIGVVARAVIMNEELAQALGINTRLVRFFTFCLGAGLAALAGALLTPLVSVHPNLGVSWLINAFMLVLVAGVSLGSLALVSVILGGAPGPRQLLRQSGPRQPHHRDPRGDHPEVPHDYDLVSGVGVPMTRARHVNCSAAKGSPAPSVASWPASPGASCS